MLYSWFTRVWALHSVLFYDNIPTHTNTPALTTLTNVESNQEKWLPEEIRETGMFPSSIRFSILSLPMSPRAITHILTFTVHNAAINRSLLAEKRGGKSHGKCFRLAHTQRFFPYYTLRHDQPSVQSDQIKNCSFNGSFYGFPLLLFKPNSTHLAPLTLSLSLSRPRFGRKHLATLLNWGHNLYLISDFPVLRSPPPLHLYEGEERWILSLNFGQPIVNHRCWLSALAWTPFFINLRHFITKSSHSFSERTSEAFHHASPLSPD